ncbi:MAG: ABC transporter permease, partial [Actinomycetota bacterium]
MLKLTLKGLRAHKLRYLLTGLAVVLGVAFMAGTMVLTDTMEKTFDGVISTANDGTAVIVRQGAAIDGDFSGARERIDGTVVDQIAAIEGVDTARGSIQGFAQLVHADGTASANHGIGVTIGANWVDDERLSPFTLASGTAPASPDDAVLDKGTADEEGWTIGDRFTVLTKEGPHELTLVGTATYGDIDGIPGSTLVATTDATAQALFAEPGRYDVALVAAADDITAADLKARLDLSIATTDSGLEAITGEADTADKQADLKDDLSFFNSFLMAFAYVALFVGTFIIYNTFSIVVAQRTKEMAMLRAIGARRKQVLRSIVLESVVVGIVAAALGLLGGIGLSYGLRALLGTAGLDIPSGSLVLAPNTIITAFVVGLTVSVLSAIGPAIRASRVRPMAALRDVAIDRSGVSTARAITGMLLTAAGVTAFGAGVVGTGNGALSLLGLGTALVIVGIITLGPVLVRPVLRVLGAPIAATGITGRYARENAHRNPKRTAATASALMIGVALVGFITILASSTTASVEAAIDKSFRADYVIDSGSWDQGFAPSIEDDLAAVDGVERMSPMRSAPVEVEGGTTDVLAMDTSVLDQLYDLELTAGSLDAVKGDGVALKAQDADDKGLALGDSVTFRFAGGTDVPLRVRALYDSALPGAGHSSWLVGLDTFEA